MKVSLLRVATLSKGGKGAHESKVQKTRVYYGFLSMKHAKYMQYCYFPLDGMLVHRRVTPQQYVAGTNLYTWVKRDKVEYSSLSKETTRRARPEPRTSISGVLGLKRSATHAFLSTPRKHEISFPNDLTCTSGGRLG